VGRSVQILIRSISGYKSSNSC